MAVKTILISAIFVIACSNVGMADNSIVVESRMFAPNQSACSLGIWLSNDEPIVALTIPIEARSVSGGAFYQFADGSLLNRPLGQTGRRLDLSPLGSADPGGAWPAASPVRNRYPTPGGTTCGGPTSNTYQIPSVSVDAISPDGWLYETHSTGNPEDPDFDLITLPAGADHPSRDSASLMFIFNANGAPGCFEIDSCCVRPSTHVNFINMATQPVAPAFTKGLVCIEGDPANLPPVITCPADIVQQVTSGDTGAIINFSVTVNDEDPTLQAVSNPASGSFFPIGTTLVTCIATDTAGLADTCSFDITIDPPPPNQPPVLQCIPQIDRTAPIGETGVIVNITMPVTDDGPPLQVVFTPASGSFFPLGSTIVTCIATDSGGLADTCLLEVIVHHPYENSVVVESKTFGIGQTACNVGVFISNNELIPGMNLIFELRTIDGAFYKGPVGASFFNLQPGSRLDSSPLGSADPGGDWPPAIQSKRRFDVPYAGTSCSGPTSSTWNVAQPTVGGTSPDAVEIALIPQGSEGDLISLRPGVDPAGTANASLVFAFDADTIEGCFEIDTACTRPANHLSFVNQSTNIIVPSFTKGVICLTSCLCECNGNPAVASSPDINVLDVVYATNVAFRNSPPIPDLNGLCPVNATDVDCDGESTVIDVVKIIDVAFRNGDPAVVYCSPCE